MKISHRGTKKNKKGIINQKCCYQNLLRMFRYSEYNNSMYLIPTYIQCIYRYTYKNTPTNKNLYNSRVRLVSTLYTSLRCYLSTLFNLLYEEKKEEEEEGEEKREKRKRERKEEEEEEGKTECIK